MFSQAVIEKLEYYVYFLQDPRTNEIFYIGKGIGNRVFNHLECAIETDGKTEKLDKIREIIDAGFQVNHYVLRHGLTESGAFEIEAAIIDFVGLKNLSNRQGGHYSRDFGLKTTDEISSIYEATELETIEPILLININRLYRRDMTDLELYDATRKAWVIGLRRNKAKYAVATYRGLTREVYTIDEWFSIEVNNKTRWGFNGSIAENAIRNELRYKAIASYFPRGASNPIKYLNC
ncbi:giy-yig endonuclease [Desulfoluna spongiiphila]|nr:giy-yig endonuclease [Desulfoluna spongiiphila]